MYGNNTPETTIGWIGNGSALVARLDANDKPVGGFFNIGQMSSALLGLTSEKIEMADTQYGTLGTAMSKVIRNTGEVTLNLKSFSPEVMEMALFGETTEDAEETDVTATVLAYRGRSVVVEGVISDVTSVTNGLEELVEDVDYIISNGSIYINKDANIEDGDELEIVYSKAAVKRIEGFVSSSVNVMIVFDGMNLANEDKPVKVTYHKVSLSPAAQRQLISSEYGDQEVKGTLEVSKAVSGSRISKMFKEEHAV